MGTDCSPEESALNVITIGPLIKSEEGEDFYSEHGWAYLPVVENYRAVVQLGLRTVSVFVCLPVWLPD